MSQQFITLGTIPCGDGGDSTRTAFQKTNENFSELYAATDPEYITVPAINTTQDYILNQAAPAANFTIAEFTFTSGSSYTVDIAIFFTPEHTGILRCILNLPTDAGNTIIFHSLSVAAPEIGTFVTDGSGVSAYIDFAFNGLGWEWAGSGYNE